MNKMKSGVFKSTLLYTITDALSKGLNFIILPLVSYYIIPEQLGIVSNFSVLQEILTLLAGQAVVNALPYFFYGRSKEQVSVWISNVLLLVLILNIAFAGIIFVLSDVIKSYLYIGLSFQLLTVVACIFFLIQSTNLILYRLEDKPIRFCVFQLCQVFFQIILVIVLVMLLKLQAIGKILSVVITYAVIGCIHLFFLYKRGYLVCKIDTGAIREILHFGIPLLPHSLSFWIKGGMDKILLTTYCGLTINGLYSMAMTFGSVFYMFNTAFSNAFTPYLQKRLSKMTCETEKTEKAHLVKMSYQIGFGFVLIGIIVTGICWLAINFVLDKKYVPSFEFVPWIILSQVIYVWYGLTIQYPYTVKKTFGLGLITFVCSLIQCLATFVCVRALGKDGIKYSLIIGSSLTCIGVWWYSNKVYPMPWLQCFKHKEKLYETL